MRYLNFNGKIQLEDIMIFGANSRGMRFGDGLFETLKFKNGAVILEDDHYSRLWKGMKQLKFEIPKLLTPERLSSEMYALIEKNKLSDCRVRITIFRGDGGLFDPISNQPNYIIQVWPLPAENRNLNENGLQLCIYEDAAKTIDSFSNLKHNNFLPYLMAAHYAKESKCNDALVLNSRGSICDSSIANVFIIKSNIIYTPPLSEGCIAGVFRKFLIGAIPESPFKLIESEVTRQDLEQADEVFLTNSIYNIRWVAGLGDRSFQNTQIRALDHYLRQTNPAVYC